MSGGARYEGFVPGRHLLDAYGNGGFRFADMSHRGSILALPSGIRAWAVTGPAELTTSAFEPVFAEEAPPEVLLIGTGLDVAPLPERLRWRFKDARIRIDVMQTGAAARTYNIMLAENRSVGAALIAVP
ncbi:MTH938/NDUFAF3 family protein [Alsobacter sp. KACC 23698]|uniref:MTH938/NDUFAF3 family protein n=1 Tax=Alsobacter sp. KACC 23698 TaxID=3149229 RepID=A0AAU7JMZ2_9HYPH